METTVVESRTEAAGSSGGPNPRPTEPSKASGKRRVTDIESSSENESTDYLQHGPKRQKLRGDLRLDALQSQFSLPPMRSRTARCHPAPPIDQLEIQTGHGGTVVDDMDVDDYGPIPGVHPLSQPPFDSSLEELQSLGPRSLGTSSHVTPSSPSQVSHSTANSSDTMMPISRPQQLREHSDVTVTPPQPRSLPSSSGSSPSSNTSARHESSSQHRELPSHDPDSPPRLSTLQSLTSPHPSSSLVFQGDPGRNHAPSHSGPSTSLPGLFRTDHLDSPSLSPAFITSVPATPEVPPLGFSDLPISSLHFNDASLSSTPLNTPPVTSTSCPVPHGPSRNLYPDLSDPLLNPFFPTNRTSFYPTPAPSCPDSTPRPRTRTLYTNTSGLPDLSTTSRFGSYTPDTNFSPTPSASRPHNLTSHSTSPLNPSTFHSDPSTPRPDPSTSRPGPTTSRPGPTTSRPGPSTSRPGPSTSRPGPSTYISRPHQTNTSSRHDRSLDLNTSAENETTDEYISAGSPVTPIPRGRRHSGIRASNSTPSGPSTTREAETLPEDDVEMDHGESGQNATMTAAPSVNQPVIPVSSHVVTGIYGESDALRETVASLATEVRALTQLMRTHIFNLPRGNQQDTHRTRSAPDPEDDQGNLADSEEESNRHRPWSRRNGRRRRHHTPVPRSREKNQLHAAIRRRTRVLMRRKQRDPITIEHLPSTNEVNNYDPETGQECCGIVDFRLDLENTSNSEWNQSAARVFSTDFLLHSHGRYTEEDRAEINAHFLQHVDYLHGRYLYWQNTREGIAAINRFNASKERKARLWESRRAAAKVFPELRIHDAILKVLGPDGMSTDEEEIVDGAIVYRILKKPWRAPEVTPWIRVFDVAYRMDRLDPFTRSQGSVPRVRRPTERVSQSSKVVSGLPRRAYNQEWLEGLSLFQRQRLNISDEDHVFQHTPEAQLLAQRYGGRV